MPAVADAFQSPSSHARDHLPLGGIGKSVLACVLAHDRQVRQSYPDGIFWLPFGQQPNLVQLQRNVARALGDEGAFENDAQGRAKLRELLLEKAAHDAITEELNSHDAQRARYFRE